MSAHKQNLAIQYACKVELLLLHKALKVKERKSKIENLHHVEFEFYKKEKTNKQTN